MKAIRKITKSLTTAALLTGLAFNFNACSEQSPLASGNDAEYAASTLQKKNKNSDASYPMSDSVVVQYYEGWNAYGGADIWLPNGSTFFFDGASLTPPKETPFGAPVTVTFKIEKENLSNNLIFTFGPHGSQFDPAATIKLSWKGLDMGVPVLYYINDDGQYIEETPDDISVRGQWMLISIHHFSRYAFAWSN